MLAIIAITHSYVRRPGPTESVGFGAQPVPRSEGGYLYEGADMGIPLARGRMMTDDFQLTDRALSWIKAIRSNFASQQIEDKKEPKPLE